MEKPRCNEWICNKINELLFKTFVVHHCNLQGIFYHCYNWPFSVLQLTPIVGAFVTVSWLHKLIDSIKICHN